MHTQYSVGIFSTSSGMARHLSKSQLRRPTIEKLLKRKEDDIRNFKDFATKESIQKSLGMYLESLKNKKK
jgi:3,2-trans-enoyl-CoA isomerase